MIANPLSAQTARPVRNCRGALGHRSALSIAGSDSGGGAGIQADLKTFSALGVYGTSAVTAITAQNTVGVQAAMPVDPELVAAQIGSILSDIDIRAVKTGMLHSTEIILAVADSLQEFKGHVVVDPVMVAKSGDPLLSDGAVETLTGTLIARADLTTPNLPEAAQILGADAASRPEEMMEQGRALLKLTSGAILLKGGHAPGDVCLDIFLEPGEEPLTLSSSRIDTRNTHGTGCTLSAAIAANLALGSNLAESVKRSRSYLLRAIAAADSIDIGTGHGPVHHFHEYWRDDG